MSNFITVEVPGVESFKVLKEVADLENEIVQNRRWFHENPELSFKEFNSAKKIVEQLKSYGIEEIYEEVGVTGVVAMIYGGAGEGNLNIFA